MLDITYFQSYTFIKVKYTLHNNYEGNLILKNRIEELRNSRGLKQEEFAMLMEVSRQTISSLENGKYNPSIFLAYKISKFFNLRIEEVFIFEE